MKHYETLMQHNCNTYATLLQHLQHYCNTYATQICDLKWFLDKNMRSQMVIGHSKHANRESLLMWEENGTFSKETWSGQRWVLVSVKVLTLSGVYGFFTTLLFSPILPL